MPCYPRGRTDRRSTGECRRPIQHKVADRGLEPGCRRSRRPSILIRALARVRSAGELVVGLDQNNLPFSTAHPGPAGLDYEIAGLLAEQLGVRSGCTGPISAHDSYPSKLAAQAALRRDPGGHARRSVRAAGPLFPAVLSREVSAGRSGGRRLPPAQAAAGRRAGRRGARARRALRATLYPSTEAVLEAVATGRDEAGYVISTRGPGWPTSDGRASSSSCPRTEPVDRFPICAAVRKSDRDLKDAIDRAWDELDRSGRLADVFARWHIVGAPRQIEACRVSETEARPRAAADRHWPPR